ncbi:DNA gyrase/topoisomerase IV subunit B [Anaerostipes sp.]|uniref:DNA gyrase/topoisomerase IV subunit B n=1 Tax=Anaerostipes sp. TaxID=1872530 RepID=UPI00396753D5
MASKTYDANSISVLEGLEAVRKRPGMYIGSVSTKGLNHLIYEIVDNSVDEFLAGYCNEITVSLNNDGTATIIDNGRGIPVGINERTGKTAVEMVFTMLHAGGKFGDGGYKISGGLHGVGASVVNALSTWLTVTVRQGGKIYQQKYERGKIITPLEVIGTCRKSDTGTKVQFLPDPEIFDKTYFKAAMVRNRLHETAYLNPNLTIHYINQREGEETTVDYHEPEGICAYVKKLNEGKQMLHEPVYFKRMVDGIEAEVAFQYTEDFGENILGFCNNIYTIEGGTHITGFKTKFTTIMNQYAREIGVLKEKDANFTGTDVRNGMTAIVSVKHPEPRFEGQTKTKLDNPDAAKAVGEIAGEELVLYFDKNLDTLKKVLACAEKSAKIRKAEEKAKTNMLVKQKLSIDSNGKLANCESRKAEECEIFIVEGDSAGGSAKTARNRKTQAILPIRGKILNVEKATMDKVLANAEIKTMINSFGCGFSEGYGNDFDITKLRYHKIIIMTDADVDGAHIATLLLTFFYRFMPELITHGHVYLATPPLYKAMPKKGEETYLYDNVALSKYRANHKGSFTLQRYKGLGEMDAQQLWETTLNPESRTLKQIEIEDARMASDVTSMLMGSDVPPRRQFIYENANDAMLDI